MTGVNVKRKRRSSPTEGLRACVAKMGSYQKCVPGKEEGHDRLVAHHIVEEAARRLEYGVEGRVGRLAHDPVLADDCGCVGGRATEEKRGTR